VDPAPPRTKRATTRRVELVVGRPVRSTGDIAIMMVEAGGHRRRRTPTTRPGAPKVTEAVIAGWDSRECKVWIRDSIEMQTQKLVGAGRRFTRRFRTNPCSTTTDDVVSPRSEAVGGESLAKAGTISDKANAPTTRPTRARRPRSSSKLTAEGAGVRGQ